MKTLSISELHAHSEHRPPGYVDDIIAHGKLEGDRLRLSDEAFDQLRRKYASSVPVEPESELSRMRFEICQTCDQNTDQALGCRLYKGCCFGLWRSQPTSQCPANPPKWLAVKDQEADTEVPETSHKIMFQSTPANMPDTINPQIEETYHAKRTND